MSQPLPYHIPGPAGSLRTTTPSHRPQLYPTPRSLFCLSHWHELLRLTQAPPYSTNPLQHSIALLRRNALQNNHHKLPRLPVIIDTFSWVGADAAVILRDPTGSLHATIHADVFAHRPRQIEQGVGLLLSDVAAVVYANKSSGFRNEQIHVHLSVHLRNVGNVVKDGRDGVADWAPLQSYVASVRQVGLVETQVVRRKQRGMNRVQGQMNRAAVSRPSSNYNHNPNYNNNNNNERNNNNRRYVPPNARWGMGTQSSRKPYTVPRQTIPNLRQQPVERVISKRKVTSNTTMAAMTDEQLDNLLGEVDLDGIIAQREQEKQSQQQEPVEVQVENTKSQENSREEVNSTVVVEDKTEKSTFANVNEAVIDGLLEGLDASDFG